jgi:hypothetical protein
MPGHLLQFARQPWQVDMMQQVLWHPTSLEVDQEGWYMKQGWPTSAAAA